VPSTVYRVSRGDEPLMLPAWEYLHMAERGRYDDPLDVFRVLYTSTSKTGALTEALADLRPRFDRIRELRAVLGESASSRDFADVIAHAAECMKDRLRGRCLATIRILDREPSFVDLAAGTSRGWLEYVLGTEQLKAGQLTARDRVLPRFASRAVFDEGHSGIIMRSAESSYAHTVALFETGHRTNRFRARITVLSVAPALASRNAVAAAIRGLLGLDAFSPLVVPELLEAAA
jgi:hypothetical protein